MMFKGRPISDNEGGSTDACEGVGPSNSSVEIPEIGVARRGWVNRMIVRKEYKFRLNTQPGNGSIELRDGSA